MFMMCFDDSSSSVSVSSVRLNPPPPFTKIENGTFTKSNEMEREEEENVQSYQKIILSLLVANNTVRIV